MDKKQYFDLVISKLKDALGIKIDRDLCDALNMRPGAFSARRQTASLPYGEIIALAHDKGFDLNDLFEHRAGGVRESAPRCEVVGQEPDRTLFAAIYNKFEKANSEHGMGVPSADLAVWAHDTWLDVCEHASTDEERLKMAEWAVSQGVRMFKMRK